MSRLSFVVFLGCLFGAGFTQFAKSAVGRQTVSAVPASSSSPQTAAPQSKGLVVRPPESPDSRDNAGRKVRKIMLDVAVTDASGKRVGGLTQSDFTLLDNRQPRKLATFDTVNGAPTAADPAQAILLIDTVNNSFYGVATERQEIEKYLSQNGGHLPVPLSIVIFSRSGVKVGQPSQDGKALIEALHRTSTAIRWTSPDTGGEGAIDRFQLSLRALTHLTTYEGTLPGRKLLIWIGPGWPILAGARFRASASNKHGDWDGIVSFANDLREARVTLYSVDSSISDDSLVHGSYYENYLKPVIRPQDADSPNLALPVIAVHSGGRVLGGSNDLAGEIASSIADAATYYTLSFQTYPSEKVNEYRPLEVRIDRAGLTARTTAGYYAQP